MKLSFRIATFVTAWVLLLNAGYAVEDAPSAPYFQIISDRDDSPAGQLPLKSSAAKVTIDGTIAQVHLTQRYANSGSMPLEAIYVFPASTRAAVHGMTLNTGGRVITAKIAESVKAKADYQTAKAEKKTAALLEEHRSNVFQMSVANLLPGDDIEVAIHWTETIPAVDSTYEFVLPTVVGPRYTEGSASSGGETWTANPYAVTDSPRSPGHASFSLDASLTTTLPLAEVTSPSHPLAVDFQATDRAQARIDHAHESDAANRDFILRWKLGNQQVDAGVLLHRGETTHHFLLQVAPPPRVQANQIPPRDYVFVVDVSGSMAGFPLDTAKDLLRNLVQGLRPIDTFNVLSFASGSELLSPHPIAANESNVSRAFSFIDGRHSGGGTELLPALKRSLALPGGDDRSRSVLLITDGYVAVDREVARWIRGSAGKVNVFTFGIGSSVNRELLESVARAGGGEPVVVTLPKEAAAAASKFQEMISSPVLTKISVVGEGAAVLQTEPDPYPDVFAARPLMVTGTWSGEPTGRIVVRGIGGNGTPFEKSIDLADAAAATGLDHPALPVLWARERVRRLTDEGLRNDESIREITSLGLTYSLLTHYTSFLATDQVARPFEGPAQTVKQPLPLPAGVSHQAIAGGRAGLIKNGSVPEPGSVSLIAFLVVLLALQRQRQC
jgi:Ca-activated chloride channel family protein